MLGEYVENWLWMCCPLLCPAERGGVQCGWSVQMKECVCWIGFVGALPASPSLCSLMGIKPFVSKCCFCVGLARRPLWLCLCCYLWLSTVLVSSRTFDWKLSAATAKLYPGSCFYLELLTTQESIWKTFCLLEQFCWRVFLSILLLLAKFAWKQVSVY